MSAQIIPLRSPPRPADAEQDVAWDSYQAARERALAEPSIDNWRAAVRAFDAFCRVFTAGEATR